MNKNKILCSERPPYMCKVCGLWEIPWHFEICRSCGWQDEPGQLEMPDIPQGGPNKLSFNQYKNIWERHKQRIRTEAKPSKSHVVEKIFEEEGGKIKRRIPTINELVARQERIAKLGSCELTEHEIKKSDKKHRIVRDEFQMVGKYSIPLIRKQDIDLDCIDLMSFKKAKLDDTENDYKTIHFFTYDWHFETVYSKPEDAMQKLGQYYALLTPEFSMYTDMPLALQINSTFKNRWCGAFWQSLGKIVIPTIAWGEEDTFEFAFDGVEEASVVAVSTYGGVVEELFLRGYNKMLEVIKPSAVICYGEPFKGMRGNIKVISPYDHKELTKQLGTDEYAQKYMAGDLYPSN